MPKYKVKVSEVFVYEVVVDAATKLEALDKAVSTIAATDDLTQYFCGTHSRGGTAVDEIRETREARS